MVRISQTMVITVKTRTTTLSVRTTSIRKWVLKFDYSYGTNIIISYGYVRYNIVWQNNDFCFSRFVHIFVLKQFFGHWFFTFSPSGNFYYFSGVYFIFEKSVRSSAIFFWPFYDFVRLQSVYWINDDCNSANRKTVMPRWNANFDNVEVLK